MQYYKGSYPTAPLTDAANGPWIVNVTVHFDAVVAASGNLVVVGAWAPSSPVTLPVSLPVGASQATVLLPASDVALWWPNGVGAQNLYGLNITFTPAGAGAGKALADTRRIGFRVFTLVTADDTNPASIEGLDGSGNLTMRFKVNGANIWSRGGNMIPTEELGAWPVRRVGGVEPITPGAAGSPFVPSRHRYSLGALPSPPLVDRSDCRGPPERGRAVVPGPVGGRGGF